MFQIISDGSCDLSPEQIESAGITVVPFYVALDGTTYKKEGVELTPHDFFEYCILHPECSPKTSMPSVQDYLRMLTGLFCSDKQEIAIRSEKRCRKTVPFQNNTTLTKRKHPINIAAVR